MGDLQEQSGRRAPSAAAKGQDLSEVRVVSSNGVQGRPLIGSSCVDIMKGGRPFI